MRVPVKFELFVKSPIIVRKKRGAKFTESLEYIPGTTLKGALASAWLREFDGEKFEELFLRGKNFFPFLFPSAGTEKTEGGAAIFPPPITARACKREPEKHLKVDTLFYPTERLNISNISKEPFEKCFYILEGERDKRCEKNLKPYSTPRTIEKEAEFTTMPPEFYRMGVGIDFRRGSAAHGILFGQIARDNFVKIKREGKKSHLKPAKYVGIGFIDRELLTYLKALSIDQYSEGDTPPPIFVGAVRSRGFGQCEIKISSLEGKSVFPLINQRFDDFQYFIESRIPSLKSKEGESIVSLTLLTPAIFIDDILRNVLSLREAFIREITSKIPKEKIEILKEISEVEQISGWNVQTQMPKEDEQAIKAGSVLLFKTDLPREELLKILKDLEEKGIGHKREDGFGRILFCDPFHIQYFPKSA